MRRNAWLLPLATVLASAGLAVAIAASDVVATAPSKSADSKTSMATKKGAARGAAIRKIVKTKEEWKALLTPEQFHVLREKGTETAFTGKYWNHHARGVYVCAACGLELFDSSTKFESGTGWPSFWKPIAKGNVEERTDTALGMIRTEALCARCGGHLGHVFDDGPNPTGLRYCMNSVSLAFRPAK